ncbi:MAG TPA: hypothetical protein VGE92_08130 [Steroidobacteraceae bacterium]
MGYQHAARVALAAWTMVAVSADARAGAIAGAVAFPSQRVPSLTVYAAGIDSSRVASVQLAAGQANFTLEVPAGRYLVFSAPRDADAPNIYGAYTQYSLCALHASGDKCENHTLIPVSISAKSPRASVSIDDWDLTDDVAARIDRMLGIAAANTAPDPDALSAPRFSEYPSTSFATDAPRVDFEGSELSQQERAVVLRAFQNGPNFAGHLTAVLTRCGPDCSRLVLVDWRSGQVQEPAALADIRGPLPCRSDAGLQLRRDSRLLSISRTRGTRIATEYYVWNQKNAQLVQSGEYLRTLQTYCAAAAH